MHAQGGRKFSSLNFSQFVEGRRWYLWAQEGLEEARVFAGDESGHRQEIHCAPARCYALQSNGMDPPTVHVTA
jgi:hypothetical protein